MSAELAPDPDSLGEALDGLDRLIDQIGGRGATVEETVCLCHLLLDVQAGAGSFTPATVPILSRMWELVVPVFPEGFRFRSVDAIRLELDKLGRRLVELSRSPLPVD